LTIHTFGLKPQAFSYLIFIAALIVVAFIDLEHQIIPNIISLPGIVVGFMLACVTLPLSPKHSLIGILTGGGIIYLVSYFSLIFLGKEGMGGGDMKLMAMVGAFLGWKNALLTIFLGSLSGSIIGVSLMIFKKKKRGDYIPFGPFLVLGAIISLFVGDQIIGWYFNMANPIVLSPIPTSPGPLPSSLLSLFFLRRFLPGLC
jgi:leader peptidase (prepilin peptidase)/N-methyltransferase